MKTTGINDEIENMSDVELRKELAFARGFGAYDELSANWLEQLELEERKRASD